MGVSRNSKLGKLGEGAEKQGHSFTSQCGDMGRDLQYLGHVQNFPLVFSWKFPMILIKICVIRKAFTITKKTSSKVLLVRVSKAPKLIWEAIEQITACRCYGIWRFFSHVGKVWFGSAPNVDQVFLEYQGSRAKNKFIFGFSGILAF